MNKKREILKNTDIYIEEGKIKQIGKNLNQFLTKIDKTINATDMIIIPGLINTHHHLFQTLFRGVDQLKKRPIIEWVKTLCSLLDGLDEEVIYSAACIGTAELLLSGCTTTSDHLYVYPHKRTNLFGSQIKAAKNMKIRFHPVRGNLSVDEKGNSIWPKFVIENDEQVLINLEKTINQYHDENDYSMCQVALGPCAYYSASKKLFSQIGKLARKHHVRLHTHSLELPDENSQCQKLFNLNALEFLEHVGFLGKDSWLAHGVYATDKDINRLAKSRTSISYTPFCSTAKKRVPPIIQMLQAGINVGIGTDGSASNDASNMIQESRLAGRLQGMNQVDESVSYFRATQILELATLGGARCLGRESVLGSIEPGKAADLAIIDINLHLECTGFNNPLEAIFHSGLNRVDYTIVNGQIVVEKGEIKAINGNSLEKIIDNHNNIVKSLISRAEKKLGYSLSMGWTSAIKKI